jgi:hypothetical protein
MKAGLYHPACRHGSGTYYPELAEVAQEIFGDQANKKAEVAHAENQVQKFKRLSAGCLEPQLKAKYDARLAEWEEILKSSQGRLTAAQGSGTIQVGGTKQPATPQLTPKQAAINRLQAEHDIQFRDSKKYPMDEGLLTDCVDWLDGFSAKYPSLSGKNPVALPEIVCAPPSKMKNAVGMYSYYPGAPKAVDIKLNGQYHTDAKSFQQYVDASVKSGWYPANATLHKTLVHEYGHHVGNSMRWVSQNPNWQKEFLEECLEDYRKANPAFTGRTYASTSDLVSRYGASDWGELFAESFAEYYGGQNPREFAQIFGTKLDTALKGVK